MHRRQGCGHEHSCNLQQHLIEGIDGAAIPTCMCTARATCRECNYGIHCALCTSWEVSDADAAGFLSSQAPTVTPALAFGCAVPAAGCCSETGATCRSLVRTRRRAPSADWVLRLSPLSRRLRWRSLSVVQHCPGSRGCAAGALPASPPAPRLFHISRPVEPCMHKLAGCALAGHARSRNAALQPATCAAAQGAFHGKLGPPNQFSAL